METITLEEVLELFKFPKTLGNFEGVEVTINQGRFGPYIKYDDKYVNIPKSEDPMGLDASDLGMIDPKLASIFTASDEDDEDDEDADETEDGDSEEKETSKKASYRPSKRTRQASVKTLGNISREASSSDELSKLWESAPDVSKFFG